jgi:hypothetical protein
MKPSTPQTSPAISKATWIVPLPHTPAPAPRCSSYTTIAADKNKQYLEAVKAHEQTLNEKCQQSVPHPKPAAPKLAPITDNATPKSHTTEMPSSASKNPNPTVKPELDIPDIHAKWTKFLNDNNMHFAGAANTGPVDDDLLQTSEEAFDSPDTDKWKAALQEDLNNLKTNDVYKVVPTPEGVKLISSKPIMQIKIDQNRNIE